MAQTRVDLKKKVGITIGRRVDFPPYGTTHAQNQPDGHDADVARLLAKGWPNRLAAVQAHPPTAGRPTLRSASRRS